jgi:hypothetical protein
MKSRNSEDFKQSAGRVSDPLGIPDLKRFFESYREYFEELDDYSVHFDFLVAEYSAGRHRDQLRRALTTVIDKLRLEKSSLEAESHERALVFPHGGQYAEVYRKAFVLLAIGLCLRAPVEEIEFLSMSVERGDPLLETLIAAAAPGLEQAHTSPAFYEEYDGLYDCLAAPPSEREHLVREYLGVWYTEKMTGFSFKDMHLEADPLRYVGYWCFEVAGVVAALGIGDREFGEHPHYPKDLVRMYRESGTSG